MYKKKTLVLEQYLIFTLNSKLNTVKVAGSAPFMDVITKEKIAQLAKISKENNIPIFVYKNNVLIFQTSSQRQLREKSGLSKGSIASAISGSLIFNALKISKTLLDNGTVDLLSPSQFANLVSSLRLAFRKKHIKTIQAKRDNYVANKRVSVMATNISSGQTYTASSIIDISKMLTALGPEEYLSPSTISICLRNNKSTKYWILKRAGLG